MISYYMKTLWNYKSPHSSQGPLCLKESDEEIYQYFQNLLVDDYPIDYQIEASREFAEYASFTTADEVEYLSMKFKIE